MASPEKAILDYLYLNHQLNTIEDIEGLRLNMTTFNETINKDRLISYAACFESKKLNKRLILLNKINKYANII